MFRSTGIVVLKFLGTGAAKPLALRSLSANAFIPGTGADATLFNNSLVPKRGKPHHAAVLTL